MAGIPITGTLTPDGSFAVVDVTHVNGAESAAASHAYAEGYADNIGAERVTHVATVAALKADPTLPARSGGVAYLDGYFVKGFGASELDWDAASTQTANDITIFQITGVATGRWRRRNHRISVEDAGAVPDWDVLASTGTDSTDAFLRMREWVALDPVTRPFLLGESWGDCAVSGGRYAGSGHYYVTSTITVISGMTIRGISQTTSRIWFNGPGLDLFEIKDAGPAGATAIVMKDFSINGGANCGRSAIKLTACILSTFELDLNIRGGFTYGWYCNEPDIANGGGVQWGKFSILSTNSWWGLYAPANLIYHIGYFNAVDVYAHAAGCTGYGLYLKSNYPGQNYFDLHGSTQACHIGLYLEDSAYTIVRGFYEESNGLPSEFVNCENISVVDSGFPALNLTGVKGTKFERCGGAATEISDCAYNDSNGRFRIVSATASNSHYGKGFGIYANYPASFGSSDPANLALGGDLERWTDDGSVSPTFGCPFLNYPWSGNWHKAKKCGVGFADTTRTAHTSHCALIAPVTTTWGVAALVTQSLPAHLIGARLSVSFKAKRASGASNMSMLLGLETDVPIGTVTLIDAVENGFTLFGATVILTSAICAGPIILKLSGTDPWYLSEFQFCLSDNVPRGFSRCFELPERTGALDAEGRLTFWADSIPTGTADPMFGNSVIGKPYIAGDRALLRSPITADNHGRSMTLTGWEYSGSAWVPQYVVASSDAQAYADFALQETDPPYAQGRFFVNSEGVPCVQMSPSVTAQLPEEVLVRIKTDDGALADGTVVYASGGQGNNLLVKKLASGLTQLSSKLIGLTTETITNTGRATSFGLVHGLDTLAYPAGTCLYTSGTAGVLTSTMPPGDVDGAAVCLVTYQHQTQGTVFVHPRTLDRLSGTTANRPVSPRKGTLYWDETVNSLMIWTGAAWALAIPAGYTDVSGTFDASTATADLTYEAFSDTPVRMPWLHRSQDDALSLHYQMPHNWTLTAVEPHVHIIQGAVTGGDLVLDGRLAWSRKSNLDLPAWANWTPFRVVTTLTATQWQSFAVSLGSFTPPAGALGPSAVLHVWLRRPGSSDSADTYEGDKVGGPTAAANVGLEYADCHVQVQGFGTPGLYS